MLQHRRLLALSSSAVVRMSSLLLHDCLHKGAVSLSLPPASAFASAGSSLASQRRSRPVGLDAGAVEVLGRAADLLGPDQLDRAAFGQHPDVVAERAERARRGCSASSRGLISPPLVEHLAQDLAPHRVPEGDEEVVCLAACSAAMLAGNIEQTKSLLSDRLVASAATQASSRTPPISVKTAVRPPSSRCSSAITCETALISARWVKAWGKLPRWRPLARRRAPRRRGRASRRPPAAARRAPRARAALADLRERRDQPEGADQEGALLAAEAVVGLLDLVAEDEAVLGQVVGDRLDRGAHALVVGGEEAQQRDQQGRGVERVGLVVLAEDAVAAAALEDLRRGSRRRSLCHRRRPRRGRRRGRGGRRGRPRPRSSASRRRSAWARRATPRSPGRGGPGGDRRLDLVADQLPVGRRAGAAQRLFVQVDRVEQGAPDVVLALVVGAVADPHRAGRRRSRRGGRACSRSGRVSPPIPYMICRLGSSVQTPRMKRMKSRASWSKPSVCRAQRLKVESRIQL